MSLQVRLFLYDLSNGEAKQLETSIIGKQIEGIWFVGIEVYGKEFYYIEGVKNCIPCKSILGNPIKIIEIGQTEVPYELFLEFLPDIDLKCKNENYNLIFKNNNIFGNEICEFLTGKKIPNWITDLTQEISSKPLVEKYLPQLKLLGESLKSGNNPSFSLENIHENKASSPLAPPLQNQVNNNLLSTKDSTKSNPLVQNPYVQKNKVIEIQAEKELFSLINENCGVIIDFWSPHCGPCLMAKPLYEEMSGKINIKQIKFCSVNILKLPSLQMKYRVNAVPYFLLFYKGQEFSNQLGFNPIKLNEHITSLIDLITSEHPHSFLSFHIFNPKDDKYITFEKLSDFKKMLLDIDIALKKYGDNKINLRKIVTSNKLLITQDEELSEICQIINEFDLNDQVGILDLLRNSIFEIFKISKIPEMVNKNFTSIWNSIKEKLKNFDWNININSKKILFSLTLILRILCNFSKIWTNIFDDKDFIELFEKYINLSDPKIIVHLSFLMINLFFILIKKEKTNSNQELIKLIREKYAKILVSKIDLIKPREEDLNAVLLFFCKIFYNCDTELIRDFETSTSFISKLTLLTQTQGTNYLVLDLLKILDI